jgi:glutamyl endopeptidase
MTIHTRLDRESAAALQESMGLRAPRWQGPSAPLVQPARSRSLPLEQYAEPMPYPEATLFYEDVIGTPDFRRVLNTTHEPFRNVCKIETTAGVGLGTGTLIRGNKVLTAAHVVHDLKTTPGQLRIIPAQREAGTGTTARPFGTAVGTRVDVPATYGHIPNTFEGDDYAVVTIDRDIGHFWRRVSALDPARVRPATVNVAGYPGTPGGGQQMFRTYGRVINVAPPLIEYDNDTRGGMSGSPIWLRWQDTRTLIGVHQIGDDVTPAVANRGVFLTAAILAQIQTWL